MVRKSQRPLSMPARAARARWSRRPRACMQVAMVQDMQAATRRLCHSQLSWFRGEPAYARVDASPPADAVAAAIAAAVEGDCVPAGERPPAFQPAWHTRDQRGVGGSGRRGRLLAALVPGTALPGAAPRTAGPRRAHAHRARPGATGLPGGNGRLSAEEERAMRQYRPRLELWGQPPQQAAALDTVRALVAARVPHGLHEQAAGLA